MKHTIPPQNINTQSLSILFNSIEQIIAKKGGTIHVTELLKILNFPSEVNQKIMKARGPLHVKCSGATCKASNKGTKVLEDIPGAGGAAGIIIHEDFSCEFSVTKKPKLLVIDKIIGLDVDVPGPFNPDVDRIVIGLPNHVVLEV